jgi:transposase
MNPLSRHYRQLVGLNPDWAIADVHFDARNKTLTLPLEFVGDPVVCPECGAACSMKDHAAERSWRHLDAMQFQAILTARVPRMDMCDMRSEDSCRSLSEKHSRFTLLFEAFAIDVLQASRSIPSAALLLGIDWSTAQVIMQRPVTRGLERRSVDEVTRVGIDEKSFGKGQDYVTVMTDIDESRMPIDESRMPEVTPDRTPESAAILWKTLSPKQRSQVRAVCMDMWQADETSTETNAPNALIVHDRFHISKYLNEAVDEVRRAEHRELQQTGDDRLKGMRPTLLFNPENLSDERNDELAALRKSTLATGRAWSIKELFRFFWQETDAVGGRAFFDSWYAWASRSRLTPIKKVARMLNNRLDRILTWFSSPISNGTSEGFNSRIQAIKSAARGIRVFKNTESEFSSTAGTSTKGQARISTKLPIKTSSIKHILQQQQMASPFIHFSCLCTYVYSR